MLAMQWTRGDQFTTAGRVVIFSQDFLEAKEMGFKGICSMGGLRGGSFVTLPNGPLSTWTK